MWIHFYPHIPPPTTAFPAASPDSTGEPKVSAEPAGRAPASNRLFIGTHTPLHSHPGPGWDLSSPPCSSLHPTTLLLPPSPGAPHEPRHPSTKQSTHPPNWGSFGSLHTLHSSDPAQHKILVSFFFLLLFWKIPLEIDKEEAFLPPRKNENYNPIYIAKDTLPLGAEHEGWKKCKLTQKLWATLDVVQSLVWDQDAIISYFFLLSISKMQIDIQIIQWVRQIKFSRLQNTYSCVVGSLLTQAMVRSKSCRTGKKRRTKLIQHYDNKLNYFS